jgi:S-DNA-T family DNA segregation ATPase FtsK/SpoIIIE
MEPLHESTAVHWQLTWHTGPDAGGCAILPPGRYVVGRSSLADVRCDDPLLEPHHAVVELTPAGFHLAQLCGRADVTVQPASIATTDGADTHIGGSVLRLARVAAGTASAAGEAAAHVRDGALIRSPRAVPVWSPLEVRPPDGPPPATNLPGGLLPTVLSLVGAGALAVIARQPMFLLFGLVGALVAVGSWVAQKVSRARHARRDRREHRLSVAGYTEAVAASRAAFVAHHLATTPTPATARATIAHRTESLWQRRLDHPDALRASLGCGELVWPAPHAVIGAMGFGDVTMITPIADMPVAVTMAPGRRVAVRGAVERGRGIARSVVVQLAASLGPADLKVVVVTGEPAAWRCLHGLPHCTSSAGAPLVVTESQLGAVLGELDPAHVLFVTDSPELLAARTSPLRRAVTAERGSSLIAVVASDGAVPHVCTSLLQLGAGPLGRWVVDTAVDALPAAVRVSGIGATATAAVSAALSKVRDPEDPNGAATGIPRQLRLLDLLTVQHAGAVTSEAIAAGWVAAGPAPAPRGVLGMAADGLVDIDLVRDGPHGLLAGTTGAGKSELLRSLVVSMAVASSPDHLTFVLVDYKGGSTFDACAQLPHVVGVVTDLDDHLADRALRSLHAELRRREQLLRSLGAADLDDLRAMSTAMSTAMSRAVPPAAGPAHSVLPRLVVVIDEFAALVSEQPDFLHALVGVAQRGRSLGVHLLLATQRPSGVISDDVRANTNLRVALRLHDHADAMDVVGDPAPAQLPRGVPGRAVMRLGPDEYVTFQAARCTGGDDLTTLVGSIRGAATLLGVAPPVPPWLPPLPDGASLALPPAAVGRIDDPDRQQQIDLVWRPSTGNLLLAGSPGAGVTTALVSIGAQLLSDTTSGAHVYVVDANGDEQLRRLDRSPRCAGVVRVHERERMMRVLFRLRDEVQRRMAHGRAEGEQPIVVLVDGFDVLRRALDDFDTQAEYDALTDVIQSGAAVGVAVVLSTAQPSALPLAITAACAERWVFHLTDRVEATSLGVPAALVPAAGQPGRMVIASTGLEAQLGCVALHPVPCPSESLPEPVTCIPAVVPAGDLEGAGPETATGDDATLLVGVSFASGRPWAVQVPDGDHLLVLGPARSGRSTALQQLACSWAGHHPGGWAASVTPRRSALTAVVRCDDLAEVLHRLPRRGPALVVVDDCELVDDPNGAFAALLASRRAGLMVLAAGRPDALRQSYGHWSMVLRRSRLGLVAATASDVDGDLVGVVLPRRLPVAARPGLMWAVDNGSLTLVQVAVAGSVAGDDTTAHDRRRADGAGATRTLPS